MPENIVHVIGLTLPQHSSVFRNLHAHIRYTFSVYILTRNCFRKTDESSGNGIDRTIEKDSMRAHGLYIIILHQWRRADRPANACVAACNRQQTCG